MIRHTGTEMAQTLLEAGIWTMGNLPTMVEEVASSQWEGMEWMDGKWIW